MLKDYLNLRKISIYSLSKQTNIPYSTLSDLCNNKVEINNCKLSIVMNIAKALNLTVEELYNISINKDSVIEIKKYNTLANIRVRNKRYHVEYSKNNKVIDIDLFKVNSINSKYVKDAASWLIEEDLLESEMEKIYALQLNEKR